jgi:hypothetical protein
MMPSSPLPWLSSTFATRRGKSRKTRPDASGLELGGRDDLATQFLGLRVRSRLLARKGDIGAAPELVGQVDALAATSDDPRDPGDAALHRAEISYLPGDPAQAGEMIGQGG